MAAQSDDDRAAAREHLANERTALAWARTGVTLAALGFALARFGDFLVRAGDLPGGGPAAAPTALGIVLVAAGVGAAAAGFVRYRRAREGIRRRAFRSATWAEAALTLVVLGFGAFVLAYIVATS